MLYHETLNRIAIVSKAAERVPLKRSITMEALMSFGIQGPKGDTGTQGSAKGAFEFFTPPNRSTDTFSKTYPGEITLYLHYIMSYNGTMNNAAVYKGPRKVEFSTIESSTMYRWYINLGINSISYGTPSIISNNTSWGMQFILGFIIIE